MSDLHLEVGSQYSAFDITPSAPFLILAGDIGSLVNQSAYLGFLSRQIVRYKKIFLVLGNHEFYGTSFPEGQRIAARLQLEQSLQNKVIVLDQGRYDIPDSNVTILGCTLWSEIAADKHDIVRSKVKDFQRIQNWSVEIHNANHRNDLNWLQEQVRMINEESLQTHQMRKIVVVTHHGPSTAHCSSPEYSGNPWSSAFATDLLQHAKWPGVKAWIFGHTHYTTEFVENGVQVMSNQRGYVIPGTKKRETKPYGFDEKRIIRI